MFQLVVRQRGLPETDARWYFQQLIIAIDYCHRMVRPPVIQLYYSSHHRVPVHAFFVLELCCKVPH